MKRNIITIAMKRVFIIFSILMSVVLACNAQSKSNDFTILDFSHPDYKILNEQFKDYSNFYVVGNSAILVPMQIESVLTNKNITDLHIFVSGKPGSMVFTNIALNPENISEFAIVLSQWKSKISGKVIIHNKDVFSSERGMELKSKLEKATGLIFSAQ